MRFVWLSFSLLVGITNAASAPLDFNRTQLNHSPKEMNTRPRSPSPKDENRMFSLFKSKGKVPDGIKVPDGMKAPDGIKVPDGMKAPDGIKAPDGMKAPDGIKVFSGIKAPDGIDPNTHVGFLMVYVLNLDKKSIEVDNRVNKDAVLSLFKDEVFLYWIRRIDNQAGLSEFKRDKLIHTGLLDIVQRQNENPESVAMLGRVAEMIKVAKESPEKKTQKLAERLEQIQFRIWRSEYKDEKIRDGLEVIKAKARRLYKMRYQNPAGDLGSSDKVNKLADGQKSDKKTSDMMRNKEPAPESAPEWKYELYVRYQRFLDQFRSRRYQGVF